MRYETNMAQNIWRRPKGARHPWYLDSVLYEVYPQSFKDSNGDGVGDLKGITQKLDYLQDLGVDALWLNPIFLSPFKDAGYDVADYRRIAPRYGTLPDLKRLLREAHKRNIRILLDLVFNHTSDQHPWFQASRQMKPNRYSKWYLWSKKNIGGWWIHNDDGRHDLYFSEFHPTQVSLNLGFKHLPKAAGNSPFDPDIRRLHREFQDITAYWLDHGIGGFRCDVPGNIGHKGCGSDQRVLEIFWNGIRKVCDRYGDVPMIAEEWVYPQDAINRWGFNMVFSQHVHELKLLLEAGKKGNGSFKGDPGKFDAEFARQIAGIVPEHHSVVAFTGNHDSARISSHAGNDERLIRLYLVAMLTQNAVPKIYYGDEIGMINDLSAPWKEWSMGRAGARTPMQWSAGANAGFSTATAFDLYLPVSKDWRKRNVEAQLGKQGSLLEETRRLIECRRAHPSLHAWGEKITLNARTDDPVYAYARRGDGETTIVILNFSSGRRTTNLNLRKLGLKGDTLLRALCTPHGRRLNQRLVTKQDLPKAPFALGGYEFQILEVREPSGANQG
jgi:glycosidase